MSDLGPRDPLHAIDEEHGQTAEWATQVRAASALEPGRLDPARLAWIRSFYQRAVLGHFGYEERHLFPALLEVCPTPALTERLRGLVHEHQELRLRLEILLGDLEALAAGDRTEALEAEVLGRGRLTIDRLLAHAAEEDALLRPLLAEHGERVRAVLAHDPS